MFSCKYWIISLSVSLLFVRGSVKNGYVGEYLDNAGISATVGRRIVDTTDLRGEEELTKAINLSEVLFTNKFKELTSEDIKEVFSDMEIINVKLGTNILDLLVELKASSSKREAKEFVLNNAILINGDKINDINYIVDNNSFIDNTYIVIKRGKKNYYIGKKGI